MTKLQEQKLRDIIRKELKANPKLLKEFAVAGGFVNMPAVNTFTSRYANNKPQSVAPVSEDEVEGQIVAIFENEGIDVNSFTLKEGCEQDTEKMENYMDMIKKLSRAYVKLANKHLNK